MVKGKLVKVEVVVSALGAEPVRAVGEMRLLTTTSRLGRAAGIMLIAVVLAAAIIPVPIVHLIGIPLILVLGLVAAIRQLRSAALLAPLRMHCPRCGAVNSFGGGLGLRAAAGHVARNCESCRRQLELRITPLETAP
jgi:hypothetical protein